MRENTVATQAHKSSQNSSARSGTESGRYDITPEGILCSGPDMRTLLGMKLMGVVLVLVVVSGCALYEGDDADDDVSLDAGPTETDARDGDVCETCALGEWHMTAQACEAELDLSIRIATVRGVPFVSSLTGPIEAGGVAFDDDGARVYVKDDTGVTWYIDLADDGTTASATASIDVTDGGCEWVGSLSIVERVR